MRGCKLLHPQPELTGLPLQVSDEVKKAIVGKQGSLAVSLSPKSSVRLDVSHTLHARKSERLEQISSVIYIFILLARGDLPRRSAHAHDLVPRILGKLKYIYIYGYGQKHKACTQTHTRSIPRSIGYGSKGGCVIQALGSHNHHHHYYNHLCCHHSFCYCHCTCHLLLLLQQLYCCCYCYSLLSPVLPPPQI